MRSRLAWIACLTAVFGATATMVAARTDNPLQMRLEAAVVSKFPQFVEWPQTALANRPTVDLCVASPNPFGMDLQQLVTGDSISGRRVAVREVDRDQEVASCQVLFVAAPAQVHRSMLQTAASQPVLTVSDDPHFLDQGGIVQLRLVEGRLRFDIDAGAAKHVGLQISSQLLRLAVSVRGGT